ncbi:hypothetical protein F5B18DRAFT_613966, partial [Nemania serpens]
MCICVYMYVYICVYVCGCMRVYTIYAHHDMYVCVGGCEMPRVAVVLLDTRPVADSPARSSARGMKHTTLIYLGKPSSPLLATATQTEWGRRGRDGSGAVGFGYLVHTTCRTNSIMGYVRNGVVSIAYRMILAGCQGQSCMYEYKWLGMDFKDVV